MLSHSCPKKSLALLLLLVCALPICGSARPETANEYINTWLVTGVFENDVDNSGFKNDWIDEPNVVPHEGTISGDSMWRYFDDRLFSRNYDDYQDLYSYYKVKQGVSIAAKAAYAHVYLFCVAPFQAELRVGADNAFKAWVNGELVGESTQGAPRTRCSESACGLGRRLESFIDQGGESGRGAAGVLCTTL